jgi:hypothetical protein
MRPLLLALLATAIGSPAIAGDVVVTVIGTVSSVNPAPTVGPFAGVSVGDAVTLHIEVLMPGSVPNSAHLFNYGIDAPTSSLSIGTASANISSGTLWIWNDLPVADGVRMIDAHLFGLTRVTCELGDLMGTMFTSADISQNLGSWPGSHFSSFYCALRGNSGYVQFEPAQLTIALPAVGANYCAPIVANSTGATGVISGEGSPSIAANNLVVRASQLPSNAFGYLLCSRTQGYAPTAQAPFGVLCLAGSIGRFSNQIQSSGATGSFQIAVNNTALPQPTGTVTVVTGETWNFQAWHRDAHPGPTSNLTDALSVTFL